ncbi:MAG: helix-turn-helix domain-containing protein [Desulfoferrobacter sp.]
MLSQAMEQAKGVKLKAAELLGISFRSLRYRLIKYGLAGEDEQEGEEP